MFKESTFFNTISKVILYFDRFKNTDKFKYLPKFESEDFKEYMLNIISEPNKLSNEELNDLCYEYLIWAKRSASKEKNKSLKFNINLILSRDLVINPETIHPSLENPFRYYYNRLVDLVNKTVKIKINNLEWNYFDILNNLNIILPYQYTKSQDCGILNRSFYKLIYYFDFCGVPIKNKELKSFWNFYKKTLNLYYLSVDSCGFLYLDTQKPDEIFIKNDITHCLYCGEFFCDGIKVPEWLYRADSEDLDIKNFNTLTNADVRGIFIKKAGIEKFVEKGEIIDSWENYPDNEWWTKSEYKLIDMKNFCLQKTFYKYVIMEKVFDMRYRANTYAPFLFMKNQTTGEYHLEGVSPNCRNLYDALKMRYKGLDLPQYEIKNIK